MRLIDADAVIAKLRQCWNDIIRVYGIDDDYACGFDDAISYVDDAPAVDAEPVVHARWEKSDIEEEKYRCSNCGGACWYYDYQGEVARSRYCPNCGAKMDAHGGDADGHSD